MAANSKYYKFAQFRLDRQNRLLLHAGRRVRLTPKMFDLLLFLVENPGKAITHNEFFDRVWENIFVTDAVLVQNIASLRRALSCGQCKENFIETIPKHGYRFTGAVEIGEPLPSFEPRKSLAVLPLALADENHPEHSLMSVSIADALSQRLSRFSTITVRPMSSVLHMYKQGTDTSEFGRRLDVDYVLSGRLIPRDTSVSVRFKLLQVNKEQFIWQRDFRFTTANILLIEEKVARRVSSLITRARAKQRPEIQHSPTRNSEAYHNYLKGRVFWNRRSSAGLFKAIECFEAAIKHDRKFGLAYSGLCDSYAMLINYGAICPRKAIPRSLRAALKAIELNPELSESHASLGYVRGAYEWNWLACEEGFRTAIELNPNNISARLWLSTIYIVMQQPEKSLSVIDAARELDPLSPILGTTLGWNLYLMQRYEQAGIELENVLELRPNFAPARLFLGPVYMMQERFSDAARELYFANKFFQNALTRAEIAQALILLGNTAEGLQILKELIELGQKEYVSPYALALVYVALGDQDKVFNMLTDAFREKSISMQWFGIEPRFSEVRDTAFGRSLLRRTNHLPPLARH